MYPFHSFSSYKLPFQVILRGAWGCGRAGGREPKAPFPKGRRPAGHWPGSNTWGPSPGAKHRVTSSSAGVLCLTPQMRLLGAPSPPFPPGEVVTSEVGFQEEWEEYPILKIPPSLSHPKNTSATNFPRRVKFYLSHFSLCLFACCKRPEEALIRLGQLAPCIQLLSVGSGRPPFRSGTWEVCASLGEVSQSWAPKANLANWGDCPGTGWGRGRTGRSGER